MVRKSNSKPRTIMLVGGGSGGHLTPLVAVAKAIQKQDSELNVVQVGQKKENLQEVVSSSVFSKTYQVSAGKFRRYHGESFLRQMLNVKTLLLNMRDFFRFMRGIIEAYILLGKVKPNSILLKGGFVSVPVGIAARWRRIPYITHDSDAIPGLANRITAKHAAINATALPSDIYPYNQEKTVQVGVPIQDAYKPVTVEVKRTIREKLGYNSDDDKVLLVVGGGLGAQTINQAVVEASNELMSTYQKLNIVHVTGKKLFTDTSELYNEKLDDDTLKRVKLIDFTTELYNYSAAADIIITRAGATNIAEFATQGKICIVIPGAHLTGGQQVHNARILDEYNAAIVLQEKNLDQLTYALTSVFSYSEEQIESMVTNFQKLAFPDSADVLAGMLIDVASNDRAR